MLNSMMVLMVVGGGAVLLSLLIALLAFISGARQIGKSRGCRNWPSTTGEICTSRVEDLFEDPGESPRQYKPMISYKYQVGERVYHGSNISIGGNPIGYRQPMEKIVSTYPVGASVRVYYNPDDLSESVLEKESYRAPRAIILGVVFVLIAISIACYMAAIISGRLM